MSRRLMALSWLSVFAVAGLLGHLTAQKLHALPIPSACPELLNTNCPTCVNFTIPIVGEVNCHITPAQSYATCDPAPLLLMYQLVAV
ncbi:MAG TPA: hypothetical protein VMF69_21860 [Gemmataceae bacterium]|nr:hypothetical protein [Gemmataceae bacterium]